MLEAIESPWNAERVVLVVTGSGLQGQAYAAEALVGDIYGRSELAGDVVFVSANAVSALNTRAIEEATDLLTAIPEVATESAIVAMFTPTPNLVYTVTPGPTATPTPTWTVGPTLTPSPIFTATFVPTVATAIPTFEPLPDEQLRTVTTVQPLWVDALMLITGLFLILAFSTAVVRGFRWLFGQRG